MTGPAQPADDPAIADAEDLWRRVHPDHWQPDRNTGQWYISTAAFKNASGHEAMSVDRASLRTDPESTLDGYENHGLAEFSAGHARHECGQGVIPVPETTNPAHAHVTGRKPRSVSKCLRRGAAVIREPTTDLG